MTPSQLRLLQSSFVKIEPIAADVSARFYARLFENAPGARELFPQDMTVQCTKFMRVISELVNLHLRSLISLPVTSQGDSGEAMPGIRELGRRHKDFGVKVEHFAPMRQALMETLAETLGNDFSPTVRAAWEAAYDVLAKVMQNGLLDIAPADHRFLKRFSQL